MGVGRSMINAGRKRSGGLWTGKMGRGAGMFLGTTSIASALVLAGAGLGTAADQSPGQVAGPSAGDSSSFPVARGWSVSQFGLRVAGPDLECSYRIWLPSGAPVEKVQLYASRQAGSMPAIYDIIAGAQPTTVAVVKPCNKPGTVGASAGNSRETLPLPTPTFGVEITRITVGVSRARFTGTVDNTGTQIRYPAGDPQPPEALVMTGVKASFLDLDRTTQSRCVWRIDGGRRATWTARAYDPGCRRSPRAAVSASISPGERWTFLLITAGHRGRIVVKDSGGAVVDIQAVARASS